MEFMIVVVFQVYVDLWLISIYRDWGKLGHWLTAFAQAIVENIGKR
jgi:hypothetical protein